MPAVETVRCPDTTSSDDGSGIVPLLLIGLGLVFMAFKWWRLRKGFWIETGHPLMLEARRKAQASLDVLRELYDVPGTGAQVKFVFPSDEEFVELVWGELLALRTGDFTARIVTPPRFDRSAFDPTVTLPLDELRDWQVRLADGSVRGGFTTQAEIRLRRQAGKPLPPDLAELCGRFVDT